MYDYTKVRSVPKPTKQKKEKDTPKLVVKKPLNKPKAGPKKKTKRIRKENKIPSMRMRKKFSPAVKEKALEKFDYLCANCRKAKPADPHHIRRKSDGGKGVFTNCLPVCRPCHDEIERNVELRQYWKEWAKKEYGYDYWMDEYDKERVKIEKGDYSQGNIS